MQDCNALPGAVEGPPPAVGLRPSKLYDARDWAVAIQRLLSGDAVQAAVRPASLDNASRFSWERTAETLRSRLLPPGTRSGKNCPGR